MQMFELTSIEMPTPSQGVSPPFYERVVRWMQYLNTHGFRT